MIGLAWIFVQAVSACTINFPQGVASGDPLHDRVIIWTRAVPDDDCDPVTELTLNYQVFESGVPVSEDSTVVASSSDWIAKIDVADLQPRTTYTYVFMWSNDPTQSSPEGTTKTLPPDTDADVDSIKFAQMSCANYASGYFHAFEEASKIPDLDFVLLLGDIIYESKDTYDAPGYETIFQVRDPQPRRKIITLDDYRERWQQMRSDPQVMAMYQQHPVISIPDDHEVSNNAHDFGSNSHDDTNDGDWLTRRRNGLQAWFEYTPTRQTYRDQLSQQMYRNFKIGNLANLIVIDTRYDHRTPPPTEANFTGQLNPSNRLMSDEQMGWFTKELMSDSATWSLVGNPIPFTSMFSAFLTGQQMFKGVQLPAALVVESTDSWDGYRYQRQQVIQSLRSGNTVFITGDFHIESAWQIPCNPEVPQESYCAVEYICNAVSSPNDVQIGLAAGLVTSETLPQVLALNEAINGGMRSLHYEMNGFSVVDVTKDRVHVHTYEYDAHVSPAQAQPRDSPGYDYWTCAGTNEIKQSPTDPCPKASACDGHCGENARCEDGLCKADCPRPMSPCCVLGTEFTECPLSKPCLCDLDPYCCENNFDEQCVFEVIHVCGANCEEKDSEPLRSFAHDVMDFDPRSFSVDMSLRRSDH